MNSDFFTITSLYSVIFGNIFEWTKIKKTDELVEILFCNYLACEFTAHYTCRNAEMNMKSTTYAYQQIQLSSNKFINQRAKKVVSDSPELVDFAIGLVNSVFNLPDGQVIFFEEFEKQKNCEIKSAVQKAFGLVEMTSGLVNVSFSLPEWQAVKMIFFAT